PPRARLHPRVPLAGRDCSRRGPPLRAWRGQGGPAPRPAAPAAAAAARSEVVAGRSRRRGSRRRVLRGAVSRRPPRVVDGVRRLVLLGREGARDLLLRGSRQAVLPRAAAPRISPPPP